MAGGFSALPATRARLLRALGPHLDPAGELRVLDLGCGSGAVLLALAEAWPRARLTGIDPDPVAIQAARQALAPHAGRAELLQGDYMGGALDGPFDLIVAESSLQFVPGADPALAARLARDLRPGGLLLCSLPLDCAWNRALVLARRALRRARGPRLDALIYAGGRLLHRDLPPEAIRERVPYAYVIPGRWDGPELRAAFQAAGLRRVSEEPVPHASPAQPVHRLSLWRSS